MNKLLTLQYTRTQDSIELWQVLEGKDTGEVFVVNNSKGRQFTIYPSWQDFINLNYDASREYAYIDISQEEYENIQSIDIRKLIKSYA